MPCFRAADTDAPVASRTCSSASSVSSSKRTLWSGMRITNVSHGRRQPVRGPRLDQIAVGVAQLRGGKAQGAEVRFDDGAVADDDDAGAIGGDGASRQRLQAGGGVLVHLRREAAGLLQRPVLKAQLSVGC